MQRVKQENRNWMIDYFLTLNLYLKIRSKPSSDFTSLDQAQ